MQDLHLEYIKKTLQLFKSYGIKSVTMDDVSRELGISKRTLYAYFTDKSDLVEQVLRQEFEEKACLLKKSMEDKADALQELFEYYKVQIKLLSSQKPNFIYDLKKYYPSLFDKFNLHKKEKIIESVMANLKRGKKEGLYRKDMDENIITKLHIARIESFRNSSLFSFEELISPVFFAEAFKYHVYAIASKKGREIIEKNIDKLIENA
ncbi:MAG: TetR/AcrR family transcriptional regulator [Chlorobi bacterium]|nr:TetR/AcrR family transcriptional regulator [Chlorobiota bacterium]